MDRQKFINSIEQTFAVNPIVAILGPRQCGKTTVTRQYISQLDSFSKQNYFDLEKATDLQRLKDPLLTLGQLSGLVVIDEIQLVKELFSTLRVLIDDPDCSLRFLILGSASRELIQESSETLAGRISYLELTPFTFPEVDDLEKLWFRGGFPRAYLAETSKISYDWRQAFIKTFLEQDIPKLGIKVPSENLRRFWMMLAHYHAGNFNASELGRSLNLTNKTIANYMDILCGTYMLRQLKPWHKNISKRQVKSPKLYIRDVGIANTLLGITDESALLVHPKLGTLWEGFALEQIITNYKVDNEDCYFWATHQGAELDLLLFKEGKCFGFEFKYQSSPTLTKSMRIAKETLELDSLQVVYPGEIDYWLSEDIQVVGLKNILMQLNVNNLK